MAWPHDPTFKPNAEQRTFIHHVRNVDRITVPLVPYRDTFAEVGSFRLMIPSLTTAELGIGLSALSGTVFKEFLCSLSDKHFEKLKTDLQVQADKTRVGSRDMEVRSELVRMNAISSELTLAGRALMITLSDDFVPFQGLEITAMAFDQAKELEPLFAPPNFEKLLMDSLHRIARGESPEDAVPEPKSANIPFLPTDSGAAIVGIDYGVDESEMGKAYAIIQQLMAGQSVQMDSLKASQVQERSQALGRD